ncbi:class I SAM-dependent methyltransferase [Spongiactinospora sp. TRM90649]|uniref:SAM-dependent methyltransferase n=1 Tax=Spongiactinospora sp. TRM90649 TaxID=3031114 RepID=UPI0023F81FE8|nr:class I SAM-dependent methyltransferase [Spongiactinospora sp. TRM90649]MDF5758748.1 class I SAM-dependent methyltransferase [Spongiactinospora sp. TRM90649]
MPCDESASRQSCWWEPEGGFFGELYMEADDSLRTFFEGETGLGDRTEAEAEGVLSLCGLAAGSRVLDCPSGYGRHSVALAGRGLDVTGVDINPLFLADARERAKETGASVRFVEGDMRKLPGLDPMDAVINMFYSFGFFTQKEDLEVLRGFHRVLRPGGRFLMHTMVTIPALRDGRVPAEERRGLSSGRNLISRRRLDPDSSREHGEWVVVDRDGTEFPLAPYDMRIYTDREFADLCRAAGFGAARCYGDWDGTPYQDSSPYLIVVATK